MAVSGLPEPCESHAKCIARLALDIMDLSKKVKTEDMNEIVDKLKWILFILLFKLYSFSKEITIGIHSGEVVTGVIGKRMPRYCLFGNTVNVTSRTETTGEKGRINVSEDAFSCLMEKQNYDPEFKFEIRGLVQMKGRPEPMKVYFLNRVPAEPSIHRILL